MKTEATQVQLQRENARLKVCLAYLCECNAATIEGMPKSWSLHNKRRFVSIVQTSIKFLEGSPSKNWGIDPDKEIKSALKRCYEAEESYLTSPDNTESNPK
jgi:hypothetical protein